MNSVHSVSVVPVQVSVLPVYMRVVLGAPTRSAVAVDFSIGVGVNHCERSPITDSRESTYLTANDQNPNQFQTI